MNTMQIPRYPITIDGDAAQIGTANELAIALDVLNGQHDRAVLEQLRPHLADIIGGPLGFANVMKSLEPANQIYLIDAIGARLTDILQEPRFLRDLLATMAVVEVEQRLLNTLGTPGLRALIVTAAELGQVLEWVYGQCDRQLIDLLGAIYLREIIRSGYELSLVLTSLDEAGQLDLIEKIGWQRVVDVVDDERDLTFLMRALPASLSKQLLEHFSREQLINLIGNKHDWAYLYDRLEPAEAENLLTKLGAKQNAA
jgi:hypothetical protein